MSKLLKILVPIAIVAVCVVAAVVLARSGSGPQEREPEMAALPVDVVRPDIKQGSFTVRAQGSVSPRIETDLVSEVAGKIVWMSDDFVAGGTFEAGDVLARVDPSDYETALLAAEAELAAARATLADERARSDAAREDFRRLRGDSSEPSDLLLRLPQVARAEAAVQAQEAAVERARRNLERTRITLPFNGMIRERGVDLGQYVNTGSNLGLAFSTDRAEVRLPLAESDLAFLGLPMTGTDRNVERPVTLTGSVAGRAAEWEATLVRTEGVVDSDTRLTYVVAEIEDPYALATDTRRPPLPVGTFVTAEIPGRDASGLVVLPSQALHENNRVYVVDENDQLQIRTVEVVRTTPRRVYVSGPLSAEDRVITTAIPAPVPGLELDVRESSLDEPGLRILPANEELAANGNGGDSA
jgi:RND family efflux transporter MFP subunit